jgi:hypothetical protein
MNVLSANAYSAVQGLDDVSAAANTTASTAARTTKKVT